MHGVLLPAYKLQVACLRKNFSIRRSVGPFTLKAAGELLEGAVKREGGRRERPNSTNSYLLVYKLRIFVSASTLSYGEGRSLPLEVAFFSFPQFIFDSCLASVESLQTSRSPETALRRLVLMEGALAAYSSPLCFTTKVKLAPSSPLFLTPSAFLPHFSARD